MNPKVAIRSETDADASAISEVIFFALSFDGYVPQGAVAFHDGFKAGG